MNMRIIKYMILGSALSWAAFISAKEPITISSAKFSMGLVNEWVAKYTAIHPKAEFRILDANASDADLVLISDNANHSEEKELVTYVARYALLPVTSNNNPLVSTITRKDWDEKELKQLFFQEEGDSEEGGKHEKWEDITVYSGVDENITSHVFASHFGKDATSLKGRRIVGDDRYLLSAIEKDPKSVTFNNLGYLFDLQSRKLKSNLVLLPLKLKKEQANALQSDNIDSILNVFELQESNIVPVEYIGFSLKTLTPEINDFLSWVIGKGQNVNHDSGFLRVDEKLAQNQLQKLNYLANNK